MNEMESEQWGRPGDKRRSEPGSEQRFEEDARVLSPSAANSLIKARIEGDPDLQDIWVEGEVFDLKFHSSGHIYFSLKDSESLIRCTFFRRANMGLRVRLENGKKVRAFGDISVYAKGGSYQLNVLRVAESGLGDVHEKIRKLYEKLLKEGLFDEKRKRPLPTLPITLGVATAATGAAIRDIIQVARSRFPDINIILAPCIVQGADAAASVASAIQALGAPELGVDVIIAGRGGGSFDDLLAFSEEIVVRAYATSRVPIVAAVGHQIDHPLCELAADAVGATPSNAAELTVPVVTEVLFSIDHSIAVLERHARDSVRGHRQTLRLLAEARVFRNPLTMLDPHQYRLDQAFTGLRTLAHATLQGIGRRMEPYQRLPLLMDRRLQASRHRLALAADRLEALSPAATLKRGYAIVTDSKKQIIRDARRVRKGDRIRVQVAAGEFGATVATPE